MRVLALTLVVLATFAAATAAQNERYFQGLHESITKGSLAILDGHISPDALARSPRWARRICSAAGKCELRTSLRKPDRLKKAVAKLREGGRMCAERNVGKVDAMYARAEGDYAYLRAMAALRENSKTADWLANAQHFAEILFEKPDSPKPLERAVFVLREAGKVAGLSKKLLASAEESLCKTGLKKFPQNAFFASYKQGSELDAVTKLLDAGNYKEAKPRLKALLASVQDDTLYNDAVNLAQTHKRKLHLDPEFRVRTAQLYRVFDVEIPRGDRWKMGRDNIKQYDRRGRLIRKFTVDYFERNTFYRVGDKKYDGSNIKGMAKISEHDILGVILKVKRRSKIYKKRMNRKISGVQYFVIGGLDMHANFARFHSHIWKGKERDWLTYRLWIIEWDDFEDLDPAAEFVRNSLRERKRKKK